MSSCQWEGCAKTTETRGEIGDLVLRNEAEICAEVVDDNVSDDLAMTRWASRALCF